MSLPLFRLVGSRRIGGVSALSRGFSSKNNKSLDDIFLDIENLSSGGKPADPVKSGESRIRPLKPTESIQDKSEALVEKQHGLRSSILEAEQEKQFLTTASTNKATAREAYVPSNPSKRFHSTAEQVQSKSPQHFIPQKVEGYNNVKTFGSSGSSLISLVGRVIKMGENTGDITPNDESGDSFHILVEFSDALSGEASRTLVRCVGSVLCDFTKQNVNEGDLVHVLGSLSVLPNTHYGAVVCVLPIGGDISVLVPS